MKTPYLIQRAKCEDRDFKKGIDSIINLDYMGSSEFEWGAIPKSLGNVRSQVNSYTYLDVPIGDKVISVFCHDSQKSEIKMYLKDLSENKIHLKEYSDFNTYINPSKHDLEWQVKRPHDTDFWWDLDNDIMFWKKNPEFEIKFKLIIPVKPI
jgi:hypothetical protein